MFVSERMSTKIITVSPEVTIFDAQKLMVDHGIRHLPVVDGEGKLEGIVSDRDLRDAMPSTLLRKPDYETTREKIGNHQVRDIMTLNPLTLLPYFTIQDTLLMMRKKKVGAMPVVDEEGFLKGILSTRDLLRAFVSVMNIDEPGTLLCIVAEDKSGQMKRIVDIISEEKISLGSVLVSRYWEQDRRAIFPYLLTNNVARVKQKLTQNGFELLDPMQWYFDKLPSSNGSK